MPEASGNVKPRTWRMTALPGVQSLQRKEKIMNESVINHIEEAIADRKTDLLHLRVLAERADRAGRVATRPQHGRITANVVHDVVADAQVLDPAGFAPEPVFRPDRDRVLRLPGGRPRFRGRVRGAGGPAGGVQPRCFFKQKTAYEIMA